MIVNRLSVSVFLSSMEKTMECLSDSLVVGDVDWKDPNNSSTEISSTSEISIIVCRLGFLMDLSILLIYAADV